jgi:YD repeat-containing protein
MTRELYRELITFIIAVLIIMATAMVLLTSAAQSQGRTFYDGAGRVVGKSATESGGTTTFYDARGRASSRASTDSGGMTTIYDARGRSIGRSTNR